MFGIDFPGDGDEVGMLNTGPDLCVKCFERDGLEIELEYEQRYNHAVAGYLDVYTCPECGREVLGSEEITTAEGERF